MTNTDTTLRNSAPDTEWSFMGTPEEEQAHMERLRQRDIEDWNRRWGKCPRSKHWIRKAGRLVHNAQSKCHRGLLSAEEKKRLEQFKDLYAEVLFSIPRERMKMLSGGKKLFGDAFVNWLMKRHFQIQPRYSHSELREMEWDDDFY